MKNKRTLFKTILDLFFSKHVCAGLTIHVSSDDAKKYVDDILNLQDTFLTELENILKVYIRVPNGFHKKADKYADKS